MNRPVAAVCEQLSHKNVVPGLAPVAALPVHLVVGGLHGVDQFQVPGEEAHETVDGELGVMLLAFGPAQLHALQDLFQALLIDVRCGVQAPLEVLPLGEPRLEQVGAHGLGVPAPPDVGQPIQHALAVVAGHLDPHEIRQLALLSGGVGDLQQSRVAPGGGVSPVPATGKYPPKSVLNDPLPT